VSIVSYRSRVLDYIRSAFWSVLVGVYDLGHVIAEGMLVLVLPFLIFLALLWLASLVR